MCASVCVYECGSVRVCVRSVCVPAYVGVSVCVRQCEWVRVCVRVCMRACVRACVSHKQAPKQGVIPRSENAKASTTIGS